MDTLLLFSARSFIKIRKFKNLSESDMFLSKKQFFIRFLLCFLAISIVVWLIAYHRSDIPLEVYVLPPEKYDIEPHKIKWILTKENETCRKNLRKVSKKLDEPAFEIISDSLIIPASARVRAKKIFNKKPLVMWSSELHMTPIRCVIDLISPFGVNVLNYNLDPARCHMQDCKIKEKLKVGLLLLPHACWKFV